MLIKQFIYRFCSQGTKKRIPVVIDMKDCEFQYKKGGGPGGQSTNKTSNNVILKHLPSGIVVKNHQTRVMETNKNYAIKSLKEKLDLQINGELSKKSVKQEKVRKQNDNRRRKSLKKYQKTDDLGNDSSILQI